MHHKIDEAPHLADSLKLGLPYRQYMLVGEDRPRRHDRKEHEGRIVQAPMPRQLYRPLGAVIEEALFGQETYQVGTGFTGRRSVAGRHDAQLCLQRMEPRFHFLDLLLRKVGIDPSVPIAVMADFMAIPHDGLDTLGAMID